MLKLVLDTNTILSASLFGGSIAKMIVDLIIADKLTLLISPDLTNEIFRKLNQFQVEEATTSEVMTILEKGIMVSPRTKVTVCRDPKDNFLLELVETAHADYIITRDKDLLDLTGSVWKDTKIIKPEDFLQLLRSMRLI